MEFENIFLKWPTKELHACLAIATCNRHASPSTSRHIPIRFYRSSTMTAYFALCFIVVLAVLSVGNAFISQNAASYARGGMFMAAGRTPLVAGNWKMNTDLQSAVALATELAELTAGVDGRSVEIAVCPPFPFLRDVKMVRCCSNNAPITFLSLKFLLEGTVLHIHTVSL